MFCQNHVSISRKQDATQPNRTKKTSTFILKKSGIITSKGARCTSAL